jgi:lipopolysaccharide heptosyltransferase I
MKILFIRVSAIGDVIHTLPALFLLKAAGEDIQISWVVQQKASALLVNQPFLKNVWVLPDKYLSFKNVSKTLKIIRKIKKQRWDAIIDFQGLFKTSLLLFPLRGKKYGFDRFHARWKYSTLFTHHHTTPEFYNIIQKNLALASTVLTDKKKCIECPTIDTLKKSFQLDIPASEQTRVKRWLEGNKIDRFILLCPNTTWPSKHWPTEQWLDVIKQLLAHPLWRTSGCRIILVGTHHGKAAADLADVVAGKKLPITILPAWNLLTIAHLIQKASLLIGPDTGLTHLADYLGTQTIAIFGPTNKYMHGPFLQQKNIENAVQVGCPHRQQKHHLTGGVEQDCMSQLKADMVVARIVKILGL